MDLFVVITTLVLVLVGVIGAVLPWRLWLSDRREKNKLVAASHPSLRVYFYSPQEREDVVLCFRRERKRESFIVPFSLCVSNFGETQARDLLITLDIPELLFPFWREGEYFVSGPAKVLNLKHHHSLITGKKIVRVTMRVDFINPNTNLELGFDLLVRGDTVLDSTTPVTTKDKKKLKINWRVQYHYKIETNVVTADARALNHCCALHVVGIPDRGDPLFHVKNSNVVKGLFDKENENKQMDAVTLVRFDKREILTAPNSASRDRVVRLSEPQLSNLGNVMARPPRGL